MFSDNDDRYEIAIPAPTVFHSDHLRLCDGYHLRCSQPHPSQSQATGQGRASRPGHKTRAAETHRGPIPTMLPRAWVWEPSKGFIQSCRYSKGANAPLTFATFFLFVHGGLVGEQALVYPWLPSGSPYKGDYGCVPSCFIYSFSRRICLALQMLKCFCHESKTYRKTFSKAV